MVKTRWIRFPVPDVLNTEKGCTATENDWLLAHGTGQARPGVKTQCPQKLVACSTAVVIQHGVQILASKTSPFIKSTKYVFFKIAAKESMCKRNAVHTEQGKIIDGGASDVSLTGELIPARAIHTRFYKNN